MAAVWNLPVVFVCENNQYAESTPRDVHQRIKDVAQRAMAYDIPGVVADGMDVFDVYQKAGDAMSTLLRRRPRGAVPVRAGRATRAC